MYGEDNIELYDELKERQNYTFENDTENLTNINENINESNFDNDIDISKVNKEVIINKIKIWNNLKSDLDTPENILIKKKEIELFLFLLTTNKKKVREILTTKNQKMYRDKINPAKFNELYEQLYMIEDNINNNNNKKEEQLIKIDYNINDINKRKNLINNYLKQTAFNTLKMYRKKKNNIRVYNNRKEDNLITKAFNTLKNEKMNKKIEKEEINYNKMSKEEKLKKISKELNEIQDKRDLEELEKKKKKEEKKLKKLNENL
jgi:hypothetical protein